MRAISAALVLVSAAVAQSPDPQVYRVGNGVAPPVLLSKVEPEYSDPARLAKLQGSVMLAVVVGEDGAARNLRVIKSLGLGLDENALAAVANWRFTPGTRADVPVAVQATIEVNFRLLMDPRTWFLAGAAFTVPPGATQPEMLQAPYPPPSGEPGNASARVAFDIDTQGKPVNISLERSSDPKWDDEVIALIREWRFLAALNNGTAVESHAVLDLARGLLPGQQPVEMPLPKQPPAKKQ